LQLLEEMKRHGVKPNLISYNAAMSACGKANRPEQALQLLQEMRRHSAEPDVISYNAAISAYSVAIEGCRKADLVPCVISYYAAIQACRKADLPEWALQLLEDMQLACLDPNATSYSTTMDPYRDLKRSEQAGQLLQVMQLDWLFKYLDIEHFGMLTLEETQALYVVIGFEDYPPLSMFSKFSGDRASLDRVSFVSLVESLQDSLGKTVDEIYAACQ
jgi:pentatricopeptide repeat protein